MVSYLWIAFVAKIRRLYDIANILTSLDLIRKVHVTEIRGRKPAFKYVGPDVYDMNNVEGMFPDFILGTMYYIIMYTL